MSHVLIQETENIPVPPKKFTLEITKTVWMDYESTVDGERKLKRYWANIFRDEIEKVNPLCRFIFKGNAFLGGKFGYDWRARGWCKHGRCKPKDDPGHHFQQARKCWELDIRRRTSNTAAVTYVFDVA